MKTVCFVSSYPPKHCGIAEFNQDLIASLQKNGMTHFFGVAINKGDDYVEYNNPHLIAQVRKNHIEDFVQSAQIINAKSEIDVVCLQLEFALYGGFDGSYILSFISRLTKPLVIVVHGSPINSFSRRIKTREHFFKKIEPYTGAFIIINPLQRKLFEKMNIRTPVFHIWHGAPDEIEQYDYETERKKLHISKDTFLIFSFGLLHQKKGFEYLIDAVKLFKAKNPIVKPQLIILGEALESEKNKQYTTMLDELVHKNNLHDHIQLKKMYATREGIFAHMAAADVVVYPYIKRDLVSSGPLSFAAFAKKTIISTRFPYATELLSKTAALFVPFKNAKKIADALLLAANKTHHHEQQKELQSIKDAIGWADISKKYRKVFDAVTV